MGLLSLTVCAGLLAITTAVGFSVGVMVATPNHGPQRLASILAAPPRQGVEADGMKVIRLPSCGASQSVFAGFRMAVGAAARATGVTIQHAQYEGSFEPILGSILKQAPVHVAAQGSETALERFLYAVNDSHPTIDVLKVEMAPAPSTPSEAILIIDGRILCSRSS